MSTPRTADELRAWRNEIADNGNLVPDEWARMKLAEAAAIARLAGDLMGREEAFIGELTDEAALSSSAAAALPKFAVNKECADEIERIRRAQAAPVPSLIVESSAAAPTASDAPPSPSSMNRLKTFQVAAQRECEGIAAAIRRRAEGAQ